MITLTDIEAAHHRIRPTIHVTPCEYSETFTAISGNCTRTVRAENESASVPKPVGATSLTVVIPAATALNRKGRCSLKLPNNGAGVS